MIEKIKTIESKGPWPEYLFDDLGIARSLLQMEGALTDHSLLCSHEVYDCLLKQMPDEGVIYKDYIIDNKIVKEIIPWTTDKDYVVLMYHSFSYDELDVNLTKIFVEIAGVETHPLKDGEIIKELQEWLNSNDSEKVANAIIEIGKIYRRYSRKTHEKLIKNLELSLEQYSLFKKYVLEEEEKE